jgi:hypothetical protein
VSSQTGLAAMCAMLVHASMSAAPAQAAAAAVALTARGATHAQDADMACAGNHMASRACLIRDLYYDREMRTFTFHGGSISEAGVGTGGQSLEQQFVVATCGASRRMPCALLAATCA